MTHHRKAGLAAALATLALATTACGAGDSAAPGDAEAYAGPVGEGEGSLSVLAWPGYAEDGSTDPAVDWVTPFEEQTGCDVTVRTFATSAEAVQLFGSGEYDVVSASGDASLRLVYGGQVQPVDTDLVPNYADLYDELKDQPWNSVDGVEYGIPHGRGANLLLYGLAGAPTAPTSWSEVWEPDSPDAGAVSPYDDAIYIADAAVYLMSTQPDLGITDPYSLDQDQFDAAISLLEQQKPLVSEYWADVVRQAQGLQDGTIAASQGWQLTANLANADGETVGAVKPEEGATGWSDTWMISQDTASINCAYRWLDWVVSPEVNAQIAEYFGEAPANPASCALTTDPEHCATFHADDQSFWDDVYYWTTPTEDCLDGRTDVDCVPYDAWVRAWSELRSS